MTYLDSVYAEHGKGWGFGLSVCLGCIGVRVFCLPWMYDLLIKGFNLILIMKEKLRSWGILDSLTVSFMCKSSGVASIFIKGVRY